MSIFIRKDKPTVEDVHVSRPLTSISVAYLQDAKNFIATQVFPAVPVMHKSDVYFTYGKDDFRRNNLVKRAPGTESAGGGFSLDATASYHAHVYSWHFDIDEQLRANADAPLDVEADAALYNMQTMVIGREKLWADTFFKTGVWGTDKSNTLWTTQSNDPEADVDTAKKTILQNTGMLANTMVVSYDTHQALKQHTLVQERFKYTSPDSITADMLARFLEVDRYLVASASYNSAAEEATASNSFILADGALLLYVSPTPSLRRPSAGYTFVWRGLTGLNNDGVRTKKFRLEHLNSDRIETDMSFDMKLVASDCGYFFANTVA